MMEFIHLIDHPLQASNILHTSKEEHWCSLHYSFKIEIPLFY